MLTWEITNNNKKNQEFVSSKKEVLELGKKIQEAKRQYHEKQVKAQQELERWNKGLFN